MISGQNWSYWPDKYTCHVGDPSHGALLTTYLNPISSDDLRSEPVAPLPTGSIIVKENYTLKQEMAADTAPTESRRRMLIEPTSVSSPACQPLSLVAGY